MSSLIWVCASLRFNNVLLDCAGDHYQVTSIVEEEKIQVKRMEAREALQIIDSVLQDLPTLRFFSESKYNSSQTPSYHPASDHSALGHDFDEV